MAKEKKNEMKAENAVIKVIGVGGAGCNAVLRMIEDGITGVEYVIVNTDLQVLEDAKETLEKINAQGVLIGQKTTKGLGAGADPEVGKRAAEENKDDIRKAVEGADLCFITAGMGGGTGTGAASVVAGICKDMDILTFSLVTLPFKFEGRKRMRIASKGRKETFESSDTLITIPNDKILESLDEKQQEEISVEEAYRLSDSVLAKAAIGISNLINKKGHINLDYADIRTAVRVGGSALMGIGQAKGDGAAIKAAQQAMNNPLLTFGITGAKGIVMNFTSSRKLSFMEINRAASMVEEHADSEAEILFGHVIADDESWDPEMVEVTIVATGFQDELAENAVERKWSSSSIIENKNEVREVELTVKPKEEVSAPTLAYQTSNTSKYESLAEVEKDLDIYVPSFLLRESRSR